MRLLMWGLLGGVWGMQLNSAYRLLT
jgi:hypothetical protein